MIDQPRDGPAAVPLAQRVAAELAGELAQLFRQAQRELGTDNSEEGEQLLDVLFNAIDDVNELSRRTGSACVREVLHGRESDSLPVLEVPR